MNKKLLFIFPLLFVFLLVFSISKTYAWTDDELTTTLSKHPYGTYHVIDKFYATSNFDSVNALKKNAKYLIYNGGYPEEDKDNDIYCNVASINDENDAVILQNHYGYNQPVYTKYSRIKEVESYDNKAQYLIGFNDYDNILIILDGDTFKGNLGDIVNDFFQNKVESTYRKTHEFYMPYESCAKAGGVSSISRYRENSDIYIACCTYQVGFNLTKEAIQTPVDNNTEDPSIYGGNNETQIDDTPTEPTKTENIPFKILGIVISSILGVIGLYLIYILSKKIYQLMKGK